MNKMHVRKFFSGCLLLALPVVVNASSTFSFSNNAGQYPLVIVSTEKKLVQALAGTATEANSGWGNILHVTGSFDFDPVLNISSGNDVYGLTYSGAVKNFNLRIGKAATDEDDEEIYIRRASFSSGGVIVGDSKDLNGAITDLLSLGGQQASSSNWLGFPPVCKSISSVNYCYTLKSVSVNYIGDNFIAPAELLPRGLPPVGHTESLNSGIGFQMVFADESNNEYMVFSELTVNCQSVDGCPQLPSDPTPDPTPDPALTDTDGDGCMDSVDFFLSDATECKDTDLDGMGNNADLDDDADGLSDANEVVRVTNPLKADSDNDGLVDGQDGFPTLEVVSSISTSGSIAERLAIKGCISAGRSVPAKLNFSGALFTAEVGDQWLTGLSAAAGKKIGISINGDGQAQMLKSLRALAPSCTINAITGQKVSLALNKAKTQAKLDAKITLSATVLVKGKVKTVKGTYTMKSILPWSPNN